MSRLRFIALIVICVVFASLAGCSRKGPVSVRFVRDVDKAGLAQLTKQGGDVVLLTDAAFWTDRIRTRAIPIARRSKTYIIGPGASQMAGDMLSRMFDEVEIVRRLDHVPNLGRYDFVIQLFLDEFDDRTLTVPLFSNLRYLVELGAEVSRPDGTVVGRVEGRGTESFWFRNLAAANPYRSDERLLEKASTTLNAAVQESLFELMEDLEELFDTLP